MTPAERARMLLEWEAIHEGIDPEIMPSVTGTAGHMFAAGMAYARAECAAQIDDRASLAPHGGVVARILREEAEKMRK